MAGCIRNHTAAACPIRDSKKGDQNEYFIFYDAQIVMRISV